MQIAETLSRYRLTVDDFDKMGAVGIFREDDRIELVEGDLIAMPPIGPKHLGAVVWLDKALHAALSGKALVSVQNPVQLDRHTELYPDVAVLRVRDDFYMGAKPGPGDVLLVIEVADTTLRYDREVKFPLYARSEIPEAWLIDLQAGNIEVHRDPADDKYREITRSEDGKPLALVMLPEVLIDLASLWVLQG